MIVLFFFFKQKTAYEMRISDWSSDVCSSDLHTELGRGAALQHIDEDALDAVLVEVAVLAEADQITQQAGAVDAWATIADLHAAPVRLPGDRAVRTQQVRDQRFLDHGFGIVLQQLRPWRAVVFDRSEEHTSE